MLRYALGLLIILLILLSPWRQTYSDERPKFSYSCSSQEEVDCFVYKALQPWLQYGGRSITKSTIEYVWSGETMAEQCQLLQIINGTVFLSKIGNSFAHLEEWQSNLYRARIVAIVSLIQRAVDRIISSGDDRIAGHPFTTELVFCLGDCVASHDPWNRRSRDNHYPDFAVVKCQGSSSIPIPLFDVVRPPNDVSLDDWMNETLVIKRNRDQFPWDSRKPQMVFRGDMRSCFDNATSDGHGYSDSRLLSLHDAEDSVNCGRPLARKVVAGDSRFDFESPPFINMPQHEEYKYVMYIHGHCHWANRLRRLLFMGMAIFKQAGLCDEFYALHLRPWVHYIPVDYNFRNLIESMEWAMQNEDQVRLMIDRMHEYAEKYNTAEFAIKYTVELLIRYSQLLDYSPVKRNETVLWTGQPI